MKEAIFRLIRMSIGKKLLLGFLFYGSLTVLIALYALSNLDQLTAINTTITQRDIPLMEIADRMVENLLAQELYASRTSILRSPDVSSLFWKRDEEFKQMIEQIRALPELGELPLDKLVFLHEEYTQLFKNESRNEGKSPSASKKYDQEMKAKHTEILKLVKDISSTGRQDQIRKTLLISEVGTRAFRVTAELCIAGLLLGVLLALIITRNIAGPIGQLKLSTREISEGNFDHLPHVRSGDELGDLAKSFQEMAIRLKQLEEMYLDANPLTRLPGGVAIEQVLKTKLAEEVSLAFCLVDLRNFKAFNDRYGYARGNEVLLATTEILRKAVKDHGKEGDFVGHIGGDDFVLVTSPAQYEKICKAIVKAFDQQILKFYDPEDQQRRYIQGKTRRGEPVSFPIMTIAIAVVTNEQRKLKSHIQIGEIAAEMKTFAKKFSQSIFVVDKRRDRSIEGAGEKP